MRWRGYERQDKHPGSIKTLDPRLRMSGTSVEDDSRKKGKKTKTLTAGRRAKKQRLWIPDQVGDDRQKTKNKHSAMRHVPGFDQGWRGYERQDKNPGSIKTLDPRLRMSGTSVEDDRKGKGALPPLTPPYKRGEAEGRDIVLAMKRKAPTRSNHQTFLPGLRPSGVPLVAVIGRPNVGKSTLFNRILGTRNAIVDDKPGVTRDRIYAECTYQGRRFQVVDTGGLDPTSTDDMLGLIRQQSQIALATADILLVIMDGRAGLTPLDQEIVNGLHGVDKTHVLGHQ